MADQTDEAANAAGEAAYAEAEDSHWPPTREDTEAIGAAAGAAAGGVFGGPVGATLGAAVGTIVGSGVYSLAQAIAGGLDPRGPSDAGAYVAAATETAATIRTVADKLAIGCRSDQEHEIQEMVRWGLDWADDSRWRRRRLAEEIGLPAAVAVLQKAQRGLFAAASAREAECKTYAEARKHQGISLSAPGSRDRGAGIGTVLVAAAGLGGVLWLASLL